MVLYLLRGAFILLAATVTMLYVLPFQEQRQWGFVEVLLLVGFTLGLTLSIMAADIFVREKKLSAMSGIFLGLIVGLLVAYSLSFVVDLITAIVEPNDKDAFVKLMQGAKVFIGLVTCYMAISMVIQTKDDFRFVIPYVEFAKQIRGSRPTVLDTSVIIDGRILDIADTRILQGTLLIPKFVLNELQAIADSSEKMRRARGRRGLDILQKLQTHNVVEVAIDDTEPEGVTVDQKLVALAESVPARVMTNDYNLNKIATLRGVEVININDLVKAVQPVVLPGETMSVKVIKPGEGSAQGIGYLDDGTMVVIENARSKVGQEVDLEVTNTLQTSAGRMIFGRTVASTASGQLGQASPSAGDSGLPDPHTRGGA